MAGMKRYMLDTNTVAYLLKGHPKVAERIVATPMASLCISVITQAELLFGLAKRPDAKRLHQAVHEFLLRVDTMPWDEDAAECYGNIRAQLEPQGKLLAPFDLLIGAHALSQNITLITTDRAFRALTELSVEDWTLEE
jgi:tRNA(fMet)-specific endonuclease VapC